MAGRLREKVTVAGRVSGRRHSRGLEAGELRQDVLTGQWVVIATGRALRPHDFLAERGRPSKLPKFKDECPFCRLDMFPQEPDVLTLPAGRDEWEVHIFPNKYPAFSPCEEFRMWEAGPYHAMEAVGYHEVLATRWHNAIDAYLTPRQLALQLEALVLRFRQLREKPSVNYIQIIKNHGVKAGASLEHPHHQILTVPVLPVDVQALLDGAERYYLQHKADVFSTLLAWELEEGKRIVYENDHFVALCPFASRVPFEVMVVPRDPLPYFEDSDPTVRQALAETLQNVLSRLYVGLHNPPYNYYLHSAPCDTTGFICDMSAFPHFRWHVTIMPRLNVWGGFELGTGLPITTALPEESAAYLREVRVDALRLE
ncbi:MAG: galactose-1-phosphate uridylyltransferase [Candidatus Andersenbacteria bacterium CG10_big_fil_rev_8_21_14_0_10_54_11]|uniref:Galactose-1-phosphate uridylyltransferase n=1 Tax=Candidatus Andersenbacteria bacterium CG10_big_fil_rev_8_21_14_0_10_54_11 TaxID=1974485 RepID=A0A2M6WYW3_9BACT|nr:MAG: galactose-1-phosphate uridylyltransferase [Candidatus Andersenbacteria bacterium CG10_big_fil_rev_8_21_14_0_10_54_11]